MAGAQAAVDAGLLGILQDAAKAASTLQVPVPAYTGSSAAIPDFEVGVDTV